jgi:hypothetical protein
MGCRHEGRRRLDNRANNATQGQTVFKRDGINHNVGRAIVTSFVGFIRLAYPVSNGRFSLIHLSGPRIWSLTKVN